MSRPDASPAAERSLRAALAALLLGAGAAPSVVVSREGDLIDVEARNAPVAEVLDAVAAELGVTVEYQGNPPRQPLTLTLRGRTPAEAVLSVLDGQGIDYALLLDASGQGVTRLLIQTSSAGPTARPRPAPARRAPPAPTPPPIPEFPQPFDPAAGSLEEDPDVAQDEGLAEAEPETPTGFPQPTPRPGRPEPAPLLFPQPLVPATPTPTPPPQQP